MAKAEMQFTSPAANPTFRDGRRPAGFPAVFGASIDGRAHGLVTLSVNGG
jgi:hypothetical protein